MTKIRWGIIGCGDVTEVKSGPGFQKAEGSELVAVMRRNGELAADYARRHHVPKWYDNADQLIQDSEVDAVYVATPPGSHMEYALKCAEAGKPVYVEKPMALHYNQCMEMIKKCKASEVPLFIAYYRRALPYFVRIKQLLDSGAIGEVRFVTMLQHQKAAVLNGESQLPWRLNPALSGGGLFVDLASHTLDIMDFLLGPIREVSGYAGNQAHLYEAEDMVSGSFVFESGVQGTGNWCFSAFEDYECNEIVGSKGKIKFTTFSNDGIELVTEHGREVFHEDKPQHIQQPLIQLIVKELLGGEKSPSSGESAARTTWVMDQLLANYKQ